MSWKSSWLNTAGFHFPVPSDDRFCRRSKTCFPSLPLATHLSPLLMPNTFLSLSALYPPSGLLFFVQPLFPLKGLLHVHPRSWVLCTDVNTAPAPDTTVFNSGALQKEDRKSMGEHDAYSLEDREYLLTPKR